MPSHVGAATVASKLKGELGYFQEALSAILTVPRNIAVPPSTSPTPTPNGERLLERVLLVDDVLRSLLAGRQGRAAITDKFAGRKAVLERLLCFVSCLLGCFPHDVCRVEFGWVCGCTNAAAVRSHCMPCLQLCGGFGRL
jgi:hypothetical protein